MQSAEASWKQLRPPVLQIFRLMFSYYPAGGGRLRAEFLLFYIKYAEKYIPCIFDDGAGYYSQGKNRSRTAVQICRRLFGILITYIIVCTILELLFKLWEKRTTRYKTESQKVTAKENWPV